MTNGQICTLATTGGSPVSFLMIGAVVLLFLGAAFVIMSRNRRARRGLALGLGTLAIASAIVFAPILNAAPAQAASGKSTSHCVAAEPQPPTEQAGEQPATEQPASEPNIKDPDLLQNVVPVAPVLNEVACGVEPNVVVTETPGVTYSQTRVENTVTVIATADAGYVFADDAVTTWAFDIVIEPCQCVAEEINWGADASGFRVNPSTGIVSALPAEWAQLLSNQGATFSLTAITNDKLRGTWNEASGQLPEDISSDYMEFNGTLTQTGSPGAVLPTGDLQFALTSTGESAQEQVDNAEQAYQAEHPELWIYFNRSAYFYSFQPTLTVTVNDSCGSTVTRDYVGAGSSSGGGN